MEEKWKELPGWGGYYSVSNYGRVKSNDRKVKGRLNNFSLRTGVLLMPGISKRGYQRVVLVKDGIRKNISIHRMVAICFLPNPHKLPQVNHIDGIKVNNTTSNLEWCDQTHNNRHARLNKLNVTKVGEENHSYGLKNKQSLVLVDKLTGEVKPIAKVILEYPQWTRRYITMMMKGERTNKTGYTLKRS